MSHRGFRFENLAFVMCVLISNMTGDAQEIRSSGRNIVGELGLTTPLHQSAEIIFQSDSSATVPNAGLFWKSKRHPRTIFTFGVIAALMAATFVVLRCFQMLKSSSGKATTPRNLGEKSWIDGTNCVVSWLDMMSQFSSFCGDACGSPFLHSMQLRELYVGVSLLSRQKAPVNIWGSELKNN